MSVTINGTTGVTFNDASTLGSSPGTWQSVQTVSFTAVIGCAYPVDTTSAAITVTLPSTPSAGQVVTVTDYAGTWATNNVTLSVGSNKLNGLSVNAVLSTNRQTVSLVYVNSTQGWLSYSNVTPSQTYSMEMYAWGGGGGGFTASGGGGGAAYGVYAVIPGTSLAVVIGGGGTYQAYPGGGPGPTVPGGGGLAGLIGGSGQGGGYSGIFTTSASQANALLIAGGGGGAGYSAAGGAGGGTSGVAGSGSNAGGAGTQLAGGTSYAGSVSDGSALQGGNAGSFGDQGGGGGGGGGYWGGGAGFNGDSPAGNSGGGGGSGYYKAGTITSAVLTAGSGATPGDSSNSLRGSYGNGGGSSTNGTQGVFIIRYLGAQRGTGGTVTSSGGYTYHTFTTAGTYTA